ncbi:BQ2448_3161 [Microbotryum intermedium]|uniref:BQ2448_3161 protein n=1 Tax=Microbotryum intermedium TaxID=269621 RepID=A0A238FHV8_9BASI|nr:BQ2448_3161 [Microbotryum intermedium]
MSTRALFRPILTQLPHATKRSVIPTARLASYPIVARRQWIPAQPAVRCFSSSPSQWRLQNISKFTQGVPVTYEELKPITEAPNDDILLIDVREPNEVVQGSIPSAVPLPLSSFEKSLSMDEGDFVKQHGFKKPNKSQPIIFFCKAGVRAQTAIDLAKKAGYKQLRNYEGSYADWIAKDQANAHDDD